MQKSFEQTLRARDAQLRAFVAFCESEPVGDAPPRGQGVQGLSVGVKDIIDVAGIPTRNGSATAAGAGPASADATVVASLRAAGARIVGKTTTTEFAFTDPTDCTNPFDARRSPGGSSSGSGAAVGAGLVDLALGTQTAGSLCRPAAYCGAVGIKPTYGLLPTEGVTPLAPSFDSVGIIARSVAVARAALSAMTDLPHTGPPPAGRMARLLLPTEQEATAETRAAWDEAAAALEGEHGSVPSITLSLDVAGIVDAHRSVMHAEAFAAHGHLLAPDTAELLRPNFRAALRAGSALSEAEVARAREGLSHARAAFWQQMSGVDVILTLPVPDGAPLLDGTTGFQDWLTPWTVFGGPLVCLPWGRDSLGRPRSVMLAGHPGADSALLAVAAGLQESAPFMPPPEIPSG